MSNADTGTSTQLDDMPTEVGREDFLVDDPTQIPLPDSLLRDTDFLKEDEKEMALPVNNEEIPDPADDTEEEDLVEAVDEETDEVDEVKEPEEDEEIDDAEASTDSTEYSEDEIDWDAKMPDANGNMRTLREFQVGFSTAQHQSAQGRELNEARKAFEAEAAEKVQQINQMSQAAVSVLYTEEQKLAADYHSMDEKIKSARKNEDGFEDISELKDEKEELQNTYWQARRRREGLEQAVGQHQQNVFQERWERDIKVFQETVTNHIPDFSEKVADDIRKFAIAEGLPEDLINSVTDVSLVKFVDDYRRLKEGTDKGAKKRKKVIIKRAPLKKAKGPDEQKKTAENLVKARAFRADATDADHLAYAKQFASKSLQNL